MTFEEALDAQLSRRRALQLAGLGAGAALLAATTQRAAAAPAAQQFQGVTLRMLTQAGADYEPAPTSLRQRNSPPAPGRMSNSIFHPGKPSCLKCRLTWHRGSRSSTCSERIGSTIYPSLLPINDFIAKYNYPMDGFFAPVIKYGEGIGGQSGVRYGLPIEVGASLVFYRTDLIPTFPTTWADYDKVLAANTGNGKYGLSFAGVPAQLIKLFLARYWSQGDPLFTPDWQPLINSAKGLKALTMLKTT